MEIIVEQISRNHKVIGCHKFAKGEVTIGRGYDNDIIVTDPHVCPNHLKIDFDGDQWVIRDDCTINGSFIEKEKAPFQSHIVQSGDVISFGKSLIRLVFPHHPVAKSIPFSPLEQLVDFAKHPAVLLFNIAIFVLVFAWLIYLKKPFEVSMTNIAVPAIGMGLAFSIWPVIVSIISHLTKHDARPLHQFGISFLFFNLMWLSDGLEAIVYFNTSANMPIAMGVTVIPIALAFSLFWLNCYIGFHMTQTRRFVTASVLTGLLFGGNMLIHMSKQPEFSPMPSYDSTLMTPEFLFSGSNSVDTFLEDSAQLFEDTRKEAEAEKEEK